MKDIHGDDDHSCFDEDMNLTCVVGKMAVATWGPTWREILAGMEAGA